MRDTPIGRRKTPVGRRIPKWLYEAFTGRRRLLVWRNRLRRLHRDLLQLVEGQDWARELDMGQIEKLLDAAEALVLDGTPYAECDCPSHEKNCPTCNGRRWVTGKTYHRDLSPPGA